MLWFTSFTHTHMTKAGKNVALLMLHCSGVSETRARSGLGASVLEKK